MTPLKAIRKFCVDCVGGSPSSVANCGGDQCKNGGCDRKGVCYFYPYRLGKGRPSVKTIRKWCLWCQGGNKGCVKDCVSKDCLLFAYRLGTNPRRAGVNRGLPKDRALVGRGFPDKAGIREGRDMKARAAHEAMN
jgi:hypothetical protein